MHGDIIVGRRSMIIGTATLILAGAAVARAQSRPVTVQELIQSGHRLEVTAGTEVLWRDPHFDRVWFQSTAGAPRVDRIKDGFRAIFPTPGTYRGAFTIAGGHGSTDVYPLIVTVH